jgi:transposase
MTQKKPYSAINVKDVNVAALLGEYPGLALWVGIDVAKEFLIVVLYWGSDRFSRPMRVSNPDQLALLVELLKKLSVGREMVIALEPTGTYGEQRVQAVWVGRLEGLMARHWPEATSVLDLTSVTLLRSLVEYGSPANLAADAKAASKLKQWGGPLLSEQKVAALVASAATTSGVPVGPGDIMRIRQCANAALDATHELGKARRELEKLTEGHETLERMAGALGPATACVLYAKLGDPANYGSARAYLKAAGLNLAERSSGKYQGQLKISKRGPSMVRKWTYLAAVRSLKNPHVYAWYGRKRGRDVERAGNGPARKGIGVKALTCVMRKLLSGVWHVCRKKTEFDAGRMFGKTSHQGAGRKAEAVLA